jgi:hypothetical protein
MAMRHAQWPALIVVICGCVMSARPSARQTPTVDELLAKSAAALADYEAKFAGVTSEEHYTQNLAINSGRSTTSRKRTLVSDVIVLNAAGGDSWTVFRDAFQVDGQPVRDRDARLQKLFTETPGEALVQAQKLMNESARYNLGSIPRNINVPTMALTFLRGSNQARSRFRVSGYEKVNGVMTSILSFTEFASPTVIRAGTVDLPATGRFWLEAETARVVKSELSVKTKISTTKITVTYAPAPALTVWAPLRMTEDYSKGPEHVSAVAEYSNFHQFKVSTSVNIK